MLDASSIFDGTLNPTAGVAVTTTRVSTNVLDLLTGRDLGAGNIIELHCQVLVAFAACTSMQVSLEVCDTVGGSYLAILFSPVIPVAQLIVGAPIFRYQLPVNQALNSTAGVLKTPGRYLRLRYTVVGTDSTGTVFSYMNAAPDRQVYFSYPENYTTA